MSSEIAVIAPDEELFQIIHELKGQLHEPITIVRGYLAEGVEVSQQLVNQGVKVIISRGGTFVKIREANLPVSLIDIPITESDVLYLIDRARKISQTIAVIGFDSLIRGVEALGSILDVEVRTFLVESQDDLWKSVQKVKDMDIPVVIGGSMVVQYAKMKGIHGVLIESQRNTVERSVMEGMRVLEALKREREWGQTLKTILDSMNDGMISIDSQGSIVHFNDNAKRVLGLHAVKDIGKPLAYFLKEEKLVEAIQRKVNWIGEISVINNTKYVCNFNPITTDLDIIGGILTFQELSHLQNLEQKVRVNLTKKGHIARHHFADIKTTSEVMEHVIEKANQYSKVDSTVLIHGESGTGKEMFAQSIHNASSRKNGPFIAVNCAALPENLLESELFGYSEGAFTGAKKGGKPGLFELAHRGTLFLDEIGEITPSVQSRLLRVLEERQVMRIGDDRIIPIDIRIACATNKNLALLVNKKEFREDLFFRLNILNLKLPPLRERKSDIPIIVHHFREYFTSFFEKELPTISSDGMKVLMDYKWPGNIRELRNVIERLMITTSCSVVTCKEVFDVMDDFIDLDRDNYKTGMETNKLESIIRKEERDSILHTLEITGGNKMEAARILGLSRTTLWRKLKIIEKI